MTRKSEKAAETASFAARTSKSGKIGKHQMRQG
jgi:hypothetical protein